MVFRIVAIIILLISVLFMPLWVSVVLGLGFIFYFPIFWEAVIIFFLVDLLYGVQEVKFFGITYVSLVISVIVVISLELIKKKLRFYPNKTNR